MNRLPFQVNIVFNFLGDCFKVLIFLTIEVEMTKGASILHLKSVKHGLLEPVKQSFFLDATLEMLASEKSY
jgi:hypothetical protein